MSNTVDRVEHVVYIILMVIGGVFMLAAMTVVAVNVIYRAVASAPIKGYYELTGWLSAYFCAIAIAVTSLRKQHVRVDILIGRLSYKPRLVLEYVAHSFDLLLAGFLCIAGFMYASKMFNSGEVTQTLKFAIWPGRFVWGLAMLLIVIIKVVQIIKTKKEMEAKKEAMEASYHAKKEKKNKSAMKEDNVK